ncbi:tetratricopeptide repeat protein [Saccharothrix coeruleofusca]|uniref:Tetratricopeptide repeat protein n=1 Tax=Saccharothrix coeruleofusca TaxID=33919 RepID=A0A918AT43_9PSEU|nr:tetratricopeptide repeat protein [Saccharothrix coeruleofusca]GGP84220.1 hypothetical protein GCM10010185_67650 [Saccharothrix coeruleofusca]
MDLGASHGIRFRFETGLLCAVLLDAHGKPPLRLAEALSAEVGERDLVVTDTGDAPEGALRVELRQRYELARPVEWSLRVGVAGRDRGGAVEFDLPDGVALRVASTAPTEPTDDGARVLLPAGPAELVVAVTSEPVFAVGDTVVLCRPEQVREAAVVVSCLPGDRFTPVVALTAPPPEPEHDAPPAALAARRSWRNRVERLSELLTRTGVRRAVVLDGSVVDVVPEGVFADLEHLRLPEGEDLTDAAWRLLRGDGGPERTLSVRPDDDLVAALFTALRTGSALRVAEHAEPVAARFAEVDPDGDEAVLVEDTGEADALVAAVYAHHRGARLVVTPRPDLTEVCRVITQEQERVTESARAIGDAVKGIAVGEALWRYLSTGGHDPFPAVEAAVSAQVPAEVVERVGDRALTAFTTGLPYPFVHTGRANWARKPIGHVVADPALVVLTELHRAATARPPAAFSLVVGTGPAPEPAAGAAHLTHQITLSGPDASLPAFTALTSRLPVELVFLNSHAQDGTILVGEQPLPTRLIAQRLRLAHGPIVLDNSSLPWTEVGRELLRVGARGYVGALWRIPEALAADYARVLARRLTVHEAPAARSVVDTGLPSGIERSYLYVGTVNGCLDRWRDRAATEGATALAACELLAGVARVEEDQALRRVLRREIAALRRVAEEHGLDRTAAYVDVLLEELALAGDPDRAREQAERIDRALPELDLPAGEADRRWAARFELTAALHDRRGDADAALADYTRCASYGDPRRDRPQVLLRLAELEPDPARALSLAEQAHQGLSDRDDRAGMLAACRVLDEVGQRAGDQETALRYAVEGYRLAVELEHEDERIAFKLDEFALRQSTGDLDGAIRVGTEALELCRERRDEHGELAVIGRLGQCHRDRGDLDTAQHYATVGLALAARLDLPVETARFEDFIGDVLTRAGKHAEALEHYRHAVETAVAVGELARGAELLPHLAVGAVRADDPEALWTTALCGGLICEVAERDVWAAIVPLVVDSMKRAIEIGPPRLTQRGMTDFASAVTAGKREEMPVQVGLLADVVVLLLAWLMDRVDANMTAFAKQLDRQTSGVLGLVDFVSTPYARRARAASGDDPRPARAARGATGAPR